ncbi:MAG: hypothetical protein E6Q72_08850 [Pseudomonas sp.]|nr:MAG: hypothetical protein E6Q72_08850 [Pseudomonas sp.]
MLCFLARKARRVTVFVVVGAVEEDADEDVFLAGKGEFFLGAPIKVIDAADIFFSAEKFKWLVSARF